jgi:hypothetical protein
MLTSTHQEQGRTNTEVAALSINEAMRHFIWFIARRDAAIFNNMDCIFQLGVQPTLLDVG